MRLTGYLSDDELDALFRSAAVYVQASLHEGFGLSLAEAMLAGAVPVVTAAGALPEVVGDTGVTIAEPTPEASPRASSDALALGPEAARRRARADPNRVPVREAPRRHPARGGARARQASDS